MFIIIGKLVELVELVELVFLFYKIKLPQGPQWSSLAQSILFCKKRESILPQRQVA